jgi:hypothetical protein
VAGSEVHIIGDPAPSGWGENFPTEPLIQPLPPGDDTWEKWQKLHNSGIPGAVFPDQQILPQWLQDMALHWEADADYLVQLRKEGRTTPLYSGDTWSAETHPKES